jgi:predicted permease
LGRKPGLTAIVVLTLARVIGSYKAMFSVVRSVLLRPLPFPDGHRLAVLLLRAPRFNMVDFASSPPEYVAYREHARSWQELAAYRVLSTTLAADGNEPERVAAGHTTWNFFETLGIVPSMGRTFTADESVPGNDGVVILSHALWTSRYGSDPRVLGRTVRFDGIPRTIIGVMPAGFAFPDRDVRVWLPIAFAPDDLLARGSHSYSVVGRLAPGTTLESAGTELASLVERFKADASFNFHGWHPAHLRPLRTQMVGDVTRMLWTMLGAVALVLLIACVNVANLLLVRGEGRAREMSLRTALGAGRTRLVWQLLSESGILAVAGGVAGIALAYGGVGVLRMLAPADLPRVDEISVDGVVLAFTMAITFGAAIACGLLPALRTGQVDLHGALREEGRSGMAGRRRVRVRQLLVISETALAVVLLVAAGLLLRSFQRLMGYVADPDVARPTGNVLAVSPGYFETMDIPLIAGRTFDERETMQSPPVAMVSEALARDYWPGRNAIGGRIRVDGDRSSSPKWSASCPTYATMGSSGCRRAARSTWCMHRPPTPGRPCEA